MGKMLAQWKKHGETWYFTGDTPDSFSEIIVEPTGEFSRRAQRPKYTFRLVFPKTGCLMPMYKSKSGVRSWVDLAGTKRLAIHTAQKWHDDAMMML